MTLGTTEGGTEMTSNLNNENAVTTIIVNLTDLDQSLGSDAGDAECKAFVAAAREFALSNGYRFDTIRNGQLPSFFLSLDGETEAGELDSESEKLFERVCEMAIAMSEPVNCLSLSS